MRRLYQSLLLSAFVATATNASSPHDTINHVTTVGGVTKAHERRVVSTVMEAGKVYFNQSKPVGQQLSFRVQSQAIQYVCPAIPGLKGFEKETLLPGVTSVLRPLYDGAPVQLLDPSKPVTPVGQSYQAEEGYYIIDGIIDLPGSTPEIVGEILRTKRRMQCSPQTVSGIKIVIDFMETTFNFRPHDFSIALSKNLPACATASEYFTVSCWYKAHTRNDAVLPLMTMSYKATEKGLENQLKTIILGIKNMKAKNNKGEWVSHVTLQYPELSAGKPRPIKVSKVVQVDETKSKLVPDTSKTKKAAWTALNKAQWIEYFVSGKLPDGYSVGKRTQQQTNCFKNGNYWIKPVAVKLRPNCLFLNPQYMSLTGNLSFTPKKTIQEKTGKKISKTIVEDSTEPTFVMTTKISSSVALVSDDWMHIMFVVDTKTKYARAYFRNGQQCLTLWTVPCAQLISLKTASEIKFGPQNNGDQLTEAVVADGAVAFEQFGCYNCQGQWVPKKFTGPTVFYH